MKTNRATITVSGAICTWLLAGYGVEAQNLLATVYTNIYEITPAGDITTYPTPGTGRGLAFDSNGNLFMAEIGGNILEIAASGAQSTFTSQAGDPTDLAFNGKGNLFQIDHNGNIFEYAPNGQQSTFATGLSEPEGLAFNAAGDLFVSGGNQSGYIYEYTPAGVQSTFTTDVDNPLGLAFNSAGDLFEADANSGNIYEFTPEGVRSTFATGLPNVVTALAFNTAGDLFAGTHNDIYEFTPDGTETDFATNTRVAGLAFQDETLPVPEPSTCALFGSGLLALVVSLHKNRKSARP